MTVPIIGVTTFIEGNSYRLPKYYGEAIVDCGGVSVLLVKTLNEDRVKAQVEALDGIIDWAREKGYSLEDWDEDDMAS